MYATDKKKRHYMFAALTFSQTTKFLDWSKLKEFADDSFKLDENGGKFSERVEYAVGKGELDSYE